MGKKTPAAPTPPDPTQVASAQSAANIASATAQQKLNMVNTSGPGGTVNYVADPNAPGGYSQNTTLSPGQQGIYDQGVSAQNAALGVANQQIGRVGDALGKGLDTSGLPALSGGVNTSNLQPGQGIQNSFNPGQQVQGHAGYQNINQSVNQAANAAYGQATSRLDPQFDLQQKQLETQLANQGLGENSTAYQNAMDQFGRTKNDAYNQANFSAIGAGNTEQNTLMGQQLAQGQFANQAAGQEYSQNQGQAAFNNTAQNQGYGQNLSADQMALQNAQFQNQARNQGLQEQAYVQNQPLNQFNSLMSSSQVAGPQGISYTPSQVNPTDVLGAYALNSQVQGQNYQSQLQNNQSSMGGLFNLGSSLLGAAGQAGSFAALSDIRLKRDVELLGREEDGLGVYRYRYLWDDEPRVGVMAQEARELRPHAVLTHPSGFLMVDYGAL